MWPTTGVVFDVWRSVVQHCLGGLSPKPRGRFSSFLTPVPKSRPRTHEMVQIQAPHLPKWTESRPLIPPKGQNPGPRSPKKAKRYLSPKWTKSRPRIPQKGQNPGPRSPKKAKIQALDSQKGPNPGPGLPKRPKSRSYPQKAQIQAPDPQKGPNPGLTDFVDGWPTHRLTFLLPYSGWNLRISAHILTGTTNYKSWLNLIDWKVFFTLFLCLEPWWILYSLNSDNTFMTNSNLNMWDISSIFSMKTKTQSQSAKILHYM